MRLLCVHPCHLNCNWEECQSQREQLLPNLRNVLQLIAHLFQMKGMFNLNLFYSLTTFLKNSNISIHIFTQMLFSKPKWKQLLRTIRIKTSIERLSHMYNTLTCVKLSVSLYVGKCIYVYVIFERLCTCQAYQLLLLVICRCLIFVLFKVLSEDGGVQLV